MKKYALIVAGGSGSRMKTVLPKQFLELAGKPILLHTLNAFSLYDAQIEIILVLPTQELVTWEKICKEYPEDLKSKSIKTAFGGENRFLSVQNGLKLITSDPHSSLVAIHDAVRPLVSQKTIAESFEVAQQKGTAVAAVPLKDSLRLVSEGINQAVSRENYRIIQTPQTFQVEILRNAFEKNAQNNQNFTDDASVVEANGGTIYLIEGSYENIKITTPEDLIFAEAVLQSRSILQTQ